MMLCRPKEYRIICQGRQAFFFPQTVNPSFYQLLQIGIIDVLVIYFLGIILKLQTNEEDYNQKKPFHDRITNILIFYWNVILNKVNNQLKVL